MKTYIHLGLSIHYSPIANRIPGITRVIGRGQYRGAARRISIVTGFSVNERFALTPTQVRNIVAGRMTFVPILKNTTVGNMSPELAAAYVRMYQRDAVPCIEREFVLDRDGWPRPRYILHGYFTKEVKHV